DDLQILPLRLFEENSVVLKKFNQKYEYILVDEYQDTNTVQYRLVKKLAGEKCNICVVGDDDQGIYSWRGATVRNILQFEKDYPGAEIVKLEKNYRSTRNILHAAHAVIVKNSERAEKELWTDKEHGDKIVVYQARNPRDEAKFVVEKIKQLEREGKNAGEISVLYRINAQSRSLEEELLKNAIPYRLVGAVRFYERREIKDILAYLRFFSNPLDDVAFMRIVNVPPRKIGKKSIEELSSFAHNISGGKIGVGLLILLLWGHSQGVKNWDEYLPGIEVSKDVLKNLGSDAFEKFAQKHEKLVSLFGRNYDASMQENVRVLIDEILDSTKYEKWLDDGTDQARTRQENLYELKIVAEQYSELGPRDSLLAFLSDVALVEQEKKVEHGQDAGDNIITLMTLHSAKGLEFGTVFMIGMEEGLLPHSRSFTSPSELEEERRLCYVGITRAKSGLFMSFAENRRTYGGLADRIPSRFIAEIPEDVIEFTSWNESLSSYSRI
ncbi:MAG: 3'-5' exonuclease, partial [Patescibacteria group bacterium]|nr:3'-5' exonuclease [Patescibacteria group bacterium]